MARYVINPRAAALPGVEEVGGKAYHLARLQRDGLKVPDFAVVGVAAFESAFGPRLGEIRERLRAVDYRDHAALEALHRLISGWALEAELPSGLREELAAAVAGLRGAAFSVRSSAVQEDGSSASFAGQLATFLNVPAREVEDRLRRCWASAFNPGCLTYLRTKGMDPSENRVAVVVQELVRAASAGVAFTADPLGDVNRVIVNAAYGMGEGVVSDRVAADAYAYDKIRKTFSVTVGDKAEEVVSDDAGGFGTRVRPVEEERRRRPVLGEPQMRELVGAALRIQALSGSFQDIEWAFDGEGTLWILQSRPITTIPRGTLRIFDNSNVVESFPGVVSPLTFSIVRKGYSLNLMQTLRRVGVPEKVVQRQEDTFRHLVGHLQGRVYYNLGNWYRLLLNTPFLKGKIVRAFDAMIGAEGVLSGSDAPPPRMSAGERAQLAVSFVWRLLWNHATLERSLRAYFRMSSRLLEDFAHLDLRDRSSEELILLLEDYSTRILGNIDRPMVNDFYAMLFMAAARGALRSAGAEGAQELLNQLLIDQKIESTRPVASLRDMAGKVRADAALQAFLQGLLASPGGNDLRKIAVQLDRHGFGDFRRDFVRHVELYGNRSLHELLFEVDTFQENPFGLVQTVLHHAASGRAVQAPDRAASGAAAAEALYRERTRRLGPRKLLLGWLIRNTRRTIANRERTRLDRGRLFAVLRTLIHAAGQRLAAEGALDHPRDVFHLALEELGAYARGTSPHGDLRQVVALRKEQEARHRTMAPAGRLITSGVVGGNRLPQQVPPAGAAAGGRLQGTGCSHGEVRSRARVVRDPHSAGNIAGEILVAGTTDPGWVFLMLGASGLISEKGSVLSHTAIIGRELGIPTIVGVKDATRLISDGAQLSMNGRTGEIRLDPGDRSGRQGGPDA